MAVVTVRAFSDKPVSQDMADLSHHLLAIEAT